MLKSYQWQWVGGVGWVLGSPCDFSVSVSPSPIGTNLGFELVWDWA